MDLATWFEQHILQIGIIIVTGLASYLLLYVLLKYGTKKLLSEEQYNLIKNQKLSWIAPLLLGLLVVTTQISMSIRYADEYTTKLLNEATRWIVEEGVPAALILLIAVIILKLLSYLLPPAVMGILKVRSTGKTREEEIVKRSFVLTQFIMHIIAVLIYLVAVFMILTRLGIDITALLAGAGVVGIAAGLAGQKLLADLINGLFLMADDYFGVGDVVKVAGISGVVEEIDIRKTTLRDLDGVVHIIPNSEITIASNYTREWSRVNINIPVSYTENLDHVINVLNRVGQELAEDKKYKKMIVTAPQVLRVDDFTNSAIEIKILGDTLPMQQWEVMGELRKRIKQAFDEEQIEIPWPHIKLYYGQDQSAEKKKLSTTRSKQPPAVIERRTDNLPPEDSD